MAQKVVEMPSTSHSSSMLSGILSSPVFTELWTSGVSVGTANTATNPLDVVKVRLQMEKKLASGSTAPAKRMGMVSTGIAVVKNEGVTALWSGLGPSLARGFFFGGARLGMYTPIKAMLSGDSKTTGFEVKILSGTLSGGLAAAVTSPIELIKTRLQAAGSTPGAPTTSRGVIKAVVEKDGVTGLWKGAMPGLIRAGMLTAAQCATYDEVKRIVKEVTGLKDGVGVQLGCAVSAGLVTTTITNPIDVIKTRMYMGGSQYKGVIDCASDVLKKDGLRGFMKGWSASYARLGPHTVIMFMTAEQVRTYAGLKSL